MVKKYYLETSTLRFLGNRLNYLKSEYVYFTSALAFVELLSAAKEDDRSYRAAKNIFNLLHSKNVEIIWSLPEQRICETFDYLSHEDDRIDSLKEVVAIVGRSATHSEFLIEAGKCNSAYDLEFISTYDNQYGVEFTKASIVGNKNIKAVHRKNSGQSIFSAEELKLPLKEFCHLLNTKYFDLNKSLTVWAFAQTLSTWLEVAPTEETIGKVYRSYNHKLHMFIVADTYYCTQMTGTQNHPGRNDFLDLSHFMYIDVQDVMVSNDVDVLTLANTFEPGSGVKPDEVVSS